MHGGHASNYLYLNYPCIRKCSDWRTSCTWIITVSSVQQVKKVNYFDLGLLDQNTHSDNTCVTTAFVYYCLRLQCVVSIDPRAKSMDRDGSWGGQCVRNNHPCPLLCSVSIYLGKLSRKGRSIERIESYRNSVTQKASVSSVHCWTPQ